VAAALRRMDEAGERSRRNVVAYLNIGLVPKAPQSFERYEACEGARSRDPARSARTHQRGDRTGPPVLRRTSPEVARRRLPAESALVSAARGNADSFCSARAFPGLTQNGHPPSHAKPSHRPAYRGHASGCCIAMSSRDFRFSTRVLARVVLISNNSVSAGV
jgi:hypothetical protein